MPTLDLIRATGREDSRTELTTLEDVLASGRNDDIAALHVPNTTDPAQLLDILPRVGAVHIDFPAFTDGRGFSLARLLRHRHGYSGELVAEGQLIPDQFAFALQCGFDAVRVDAAEAARHTPEAWAAALDEFDLTYQRGYAVRTGPATNIFEARATHAEADPARDPFSG